MKLLITRPLPQAVIEAARATFDVEVRESTAPMEAAELRRALANFDVVLPTLGDVFSADVFTDVAQLRAKMLANFGVGFTHIDIDAAKAAGIQVSNTPGAVTDATADIAMTLMLMSARRAGEGDRLVRSGAWEGWHPTQMLGLHLSGKHVGILGMGRIGEAIARRCHFGFGMQVSYFNRSAKTVDFEATQVGSLIALAQQVDVLVVAVPGGATRHLVNAEVLAVMQPHAHLINIARGEIVEEAALIAALQAGQIAGAGLDVYEFEPKVPEALKQMETVTLLPHLGTATLEVRTSMGMMAVENAVAYAVGKPVPNPV
ncbi:2-hydroxyacid dehydrogenase [Planktotalea arctica]|uniref:2-hydroxyacid dehydrogenase n=1 Tax=Planktotalea arctica TaxID=1481893 RepID=UPI000A1750F4|nr:D-glycerate dehydrogenase [Planktotalea arctica]